LLRFVKIYAIFMIIGPVKCDENIMNLKYKKRIKIAVKIKNCHAYNLPPTTAVTNSKTSVLIV
jgi:hypothetical protein